MGKFVEKYVRTALREIDNTYHDMKPVQIINTGKEITIRIGDESFSISRSGFKLDYEETDTTETDDE